MSYLAESFNAVLVNLAIESPALIFLHRPLNRPFAQGYGGQVVRVIFQPVFQTGVVEGEAGDLNVKADGVAGEVAFGPAPVAVLDEEAGRGGIPAKLPQVQGNACQSGDNGDTIHV